ncbi:MAG: TldD/PmbA family protein [Firmicutes bacterium]|nr:TldD/PmbA family protein [Bacillota bacterium]
MDVLLLEGLKIAREQGVDYAELRGVTSTEQLISVKNGSLDTLMESETRGIGVRVLLAGYWGFAAAPALLPEQIEELVLQAMAVARASALGGGEPARLSPYVSVQTSYKSPLEEDPFAIPNADKLELLLAADQEMNLPGVAVRQAQMRFRRERKQFVSTLDSVIDQTFVYSGGGLTITAVTDEDAQVRTYPCGFGGNYASRGYEYIRELDLVGNARKTAEQALELVRAPLCPDEETDIIIAGSQLALHLHETCGHAVELDRALGSEISLAGGSFLTPDKLGNYRYGSNIVNITADATISGAPGSFAYDDEGVKAQVTPIIRNGIFQNYLSGRESAGAIGRFSSGAMRAQSWHHLPLVRMTNVNLHPGHGSLADLVGGIERGLLLETNRSFSIDDQRLNFQFGTEIGWRIAGGKITHMVKNPVYTGITPEFWSRCDGIAGPEAWQMWGIPNCGKGEPLQAMMVGHGAAPARFRRVKAGAAR